MMISTMVLSLLLAIWGIEFGIGVYLVYIAIRERQRQRRMKQ